MPTWLYPLLFLACPLGMGLMMWMMRGEKARSVDAGTDSHQVELARLQSEIDELKAQRNSSGAELP